MKRQHGNMLAALLLVGLAAVQIRAEAQQANSGDEAFRSFRQAVEQYVTFQRRLRRETPPLVVSPTSAAVSRASDILAVAIQRARPKAQQGDFFDAASAKAIASRLRTALDGTDVRQLLVTINDIDPPTVNGPPRIYMRFPGAASMATMPTRLLDALPPLPVELEFRFIGRRLVLRDRDAALILDYVEALPPR